MKKELDNIKKTGFNVPKDYFNGLDNQIINKIQLSDSLKNSNETGFKTPDGYLDRFEDTILRKLKKDNTKVVSIFNKRNIIYVSGIAATIFIMLGYFLNNNEINIDNLDTEVVKNYIVDEGFDTYVIASLLTDEELTNINTEILNDTFNETLLEDYLIENIDLEDIIEQ